MRIPVVIDNSTILKERVVEDKIDPENYQEPEIIIETDKDELLSL